MTLAEYLCLVLEGDAGVAALAKDRIYPEVMPQAPKVPAVVFNVVAGDEDVALDGPTGARSLRLQVDAWAATRAAAASLGRAVRTVLSDHSGAAAGFEVQGVFLVNESWDFEPETKLHRVIQDFEIHVAGEES